MEMCLFKEDNVSKYLLVKQQKSLCLFCKDEGFEGIVYSVECRVR